MLILSFAHNFPLALSSTASLRIGTFIGKNQLRKAKIAGFSAIFWGTLFMGLSASALFLFPDYVLGMFSTNPEAIASGKNIALLVGLCLILDGLQGCTIGALRGAGDSKFSFYASVIGYYPIALFLSYAFCFWLKLGLTGLWLGLVVGFASVSLLVFSFWINFKPKLILISAEHEAS
jgi:MATE family multidrug resistance protein